MSSATIHLLADAAGMSPDAVRQELRALGATVDEARDTVDSATAEIFLRRVGSPRAEAIANILKPRPSSLEPCQWQQKFVDDFYLGDDKQQSKSAGDAIADALTAAEWPARWHPNRWMNPEDLRTDNVRKPTAGPDQAPDLVEPIIAWRSWSVGRDRVYEPGPDQTVGFSAYRQMHYRDVWHLGSAVKNCRWPARAEIVATCRRSHFGFDIAAPPSHVAPVPHCQCGIYAAKDSDLAGEYVGHVFGAAADAYVLGRVKLWGTVIETDRGWRASHAYPAALCVIDPAPRDYASPDIVRVLADQYGLPVETLDVEAVPTRRAARLTVISTVAPATTVDLTNAIRSLSIGVDRLSIGVDVARLSLDDFRTLHPDRPMGSRRRGGRRRRRRRAKLLRHSRAT